MWLGDIPVASIRTNSNGTGVGVFYIHTDHLNTPIKMTEPTTNAVVWRWDHDPYGNGAPNEDPDGNGATVKMNLRFAGQYFDQETGLNYNWHRYFDPTTGGFITSDPIGLAGGINTYAYVDGNPISLIDPYGLFGWPAIPEPIFNYTVGLADDLSLGIGPIARRALGLDGGVNRCSTAYKAGQYTGLAVGAGRLAYAGAVKAVSLAPGVTGMGASAFRNAAKRLFRGPLGGSNYRIYSYEELLEQKGSDAAVKAAAGRTDPLLNAIGADAVTGGAVDSVNCGCQ